MTPVLLLPWFLPMVLEGRGATLLMEAGRQPGPVADSLDAMSGRLAGVAAPLWAGLMLAVLAVGALLLRRSRGLVLVAWCAAGAAAVLVALLSREVLHLPTIDVRPGTGFLIVVIQAAAVVAVMLGIQQLWIGSADGESRRRRTLAVAALAVAAVVPIGGLGWALFSGQVTLSENATSSIPAYMTQNAELGPEHGILVVTGSVADGLTYTVQRDDGVTLGEDEVLALTPPDPSLTADISALISEPAPEVVDAVAKHGIEYVVLPGPADGQVAAGLDATAGLEQASTENPETRAWHLAPAPSATSLAGHTSWTRWLLIGIQAFVLLTVAVLCGPTRRASR